MNSRIFVLLLVAAVALNPVGIAVAEQEAGNVPTTTTASSASTASNGENATALEWIDPVTAIVSAEHQGETLVLVIHSKISQRATFVDGGALMTGGEMARRTERLEEGKNRVVVPVTEFNGRVAVTISTQNVLYAKTVRTESDILPGPYDKQDVQVASLAGLASGLGVTVLIAWRRIRGVSERPRRVL